MTTDVRKRQPVSDNRIHFYASWDEYRLFARAIGDQAVRIAYDGERVELMSPGPEHETLKELAACLVRALAAALLVPCKSMGSTRWERPDAWRALEADACFYLAADKIAVAKRRHANAADYPIPDLAIEIDIRPSQIDREGIYSVLGVNEVWRFDGKTVRIDRLGPDGGYVEVPESVALGARPGEIISLLSLEAEDDNDLTRRILDWARETLVPRQEARREDGGA